MVNKKEGKIKKFFIFLFYHFRNMVIIGVAFFVLVFALATASILNTRHADLNRKSQELIAKSRKAQLESLEESLNKNIEDVKSINKIADEDRSSASSNDKAKEKRVVKRTEVPFYDFGEPEGNLDIPYEVNRSNPTLIYTSPFPVAELGESKTSLDKSGASQDGGASDNSGVTSAIGSTVGGGTPTTTGPVTEGGTGDNGSGGGTTTTGGAMLATAPVLNDPGSTNTNGTFILEWSVSTSDSGIKLYELQESTKSDFTTIKTIKSTTETKYQFSFHDNGTFYYRVRAEDNNGYSGLWSNTVDIIVNHPAGPTTPLLNDVTRNTGDTGGNNAKEADYRVSWLASTSAAGLKFYHIQEATDSLFTKNVSIIDISPTELSYQISLKQPNGTYFYRISAEDINGFISGWSNSLSITINCPSPTPPDSPVIKDPGSPNLTGSYKIEWEIPASGAGIAGYELQESMNADFSGNVIIKNLKDTELSASYTLRDSGVYFYRVRAQDKNGFKSSWGTFTLVVARPLLEPAPVLNDISKNNVDNGYTKEADYLVSWTASSSPAGLKSYHLQESIDPTFSQNFTITYLDPAVLTKQYTLKQPNGTYFYRVRAEANDGALSAWSEVKNVSINCPSPTPPTVVTVTDLGGTNSTGSYLLDWTDSQSGAGIKTYEIKESYRVGTTGLPKYSYFYTSDSQYQFSQKDNGTYYYIVRAEDINGFKGTYSTPSVKLIVTHPAAPSKPTIIGIEKNNVDNGYRKEADYLVTWTQSTAPAGLKFYHLEEATDSGFTQNVTALDILPDVLSKQFILKQPNGTYFYRIRGEDINGFMSVWSNALSITINCPAPTPPTEPVLSDPGTTLSYDNFLVDWSDSSAGGTVKNYLIEESATEDFGEIRDSWTVSESKYQFTEHEDGTYYYRVKCEDKNGFTSGWSNVVDIILRVPRDYINIEAEDLTEVAHNIVYDDSTSWGKSYIVSSGSGTISEYQFNIPREKTYAIFVRLSQESDIADSIDIQFNSDSQITLGDLTGNETPWAWVGYENGNTSSKIKVLLPQGKNTLSIITSEPDVKIDSIIITDNLSFMPTDDPPELNTASWAQIVDNGFGDIKNHEAKMMDANGVLYVSTSNSNLHPAIYKTDDGINFQRAYELKTSYNSGYYMYRTLDIKYLDLGINSGLYTITDDWYGSCYITKLNNDGTFTTISLGRRDWWTKDIISFKDYAYTGFYNDWNLWFTMRRTQDPMTKASWLNVSEPAFGKDPITGKQYANMDTDSSAVFKGYLYIGTYNYGYFGRITSGAQIWRTQDGNQWEQVVGNGFGSTNKRSISHMTVFGGYLYATTSEAFGPSYIYRSKDGITWELAYQGMSNEPYIGDITSYMGRLYLTTYNWGGRVYSSPDGAIWTPVSVSYMNNNSANSLVGDIHIFKGHVYVNTRNGATGTNIFRAKLVE